MGTEGEPEKLNVWRRDSDAEPRSAHPQNQAQRRPPVGSETKFPPLVASLAVASLMITVGALVCGWSIDFFGEPGSLALWLLGALAGYATQRFSTGRDTKAAILLCVACVMAFVVAEIMWIRWNILDVDTFGEAVSLFPKFLSEYRTSALIGGVATLFGCMSVCRYMVARPTREFGAAQHPYDRR